MFFRAFSRSWKVFPKTFWYGYLEWDEREKAVVRDFIFLFFFLLSCRCLTGWPGIHYFTYLQTTSVSNRGNALLLSNWKPHIPGDCCATSSASATFQWGLEWHCDWPLRPVATQRIQIRPPASKWMCADGKDVCFFCWCSIPQRK